MLFRSLEETWWEDKIQSFLVSWIQPHQEKEAILVAGIYLSLQGSIYHSIHYCQASVEEISEAFGKTNSTLTSTVTDDVVITLVILASIALLEFLQLLFYWTLGQSIIYLSVYQRAGKIQEKKRKERSVHRG